MEIKTSSLTSLVLFLLSPSPKPVLGVGTLDIENCREASRSSCKQNWKRKTFLIQQQRSHKMILQKKTL